MTESLEYKNSGKDLNLCSQYVTVNTGDSPVRLAYVYDSGMFYLISSDFDARWPSHLLRERKTDFVIDGEHRSGVPELITSGDERTGVLEKFIAKYGKDYVSKYFSSPARFLKIGGGTGPEVSGSNYYRWLEEEFDSVADDYDKHIFGNRVNVLLRDRSLGKIRKFAGKRQNILEIGCGTGAETLELLRDGHEVLAIDISGRMLENIQRKAREEGFMESLRTRKLRAANVGELLETSGQRSFDIGYSTYGALNCEPNIEAVPRALSMLLKPGGYFIAGVYNKFCIAEIASNALSMNGSRLFWRLKNPVREGRSRFCIDVYSFSFREFMGIFGEYFRALETEGVPVILPPSNFRRLLDLLGRRFELLDATDRRISGIWPLKYLGDHFLTVLQNR
ncbi:MAG: class I SAM-dependent methyltransferase [Thermoplasmataceae archaeon]